jgi:hypothetical protein
MPALFGLRVLARSAAPLLRLDLSMPQSARVLRNRHLALKDAVDLLVGNHCATADSDERDQAHLFPAVERGFRERDRRVADGISPLAAKGGHATSSPLCAEIRGLPWSRNDRDGRLGHLVIAPEEGVGPFQGGGRSRRNGEEGLRMWCRRSLRSWRKYPAKVVSTPRSFPTPAAPNTRPRASKALAPSNVKRDSRTHPNYVPEDLRAAQYANARES